jgi:hypothetical protein
MYSKLSKKQLNLVWEKGKPISNENPDKYRHDKFGNWISKEEFEKPDLLGWEVRKINSRKSVKVENLEPLFWKNAQGF